MRVCGNLGLLRKLFDDRPAFVTHFARTLSESGWRAQITLIRNSGTSSALAGDVFLLEDHESVRVLPHKPFQVTVLQNGNFSPLLVTAITAPISCVSYLCQCMNADAGGHTVCVTDGYAYPRTCWSL